MTRVVSRREAINLGLKRYFTGAPCKHGHLAERILSNGICSECKVLIQSKYRSVHVERLKLRASDPDVKRRKSDVNKQYIKDPDVYDRLRQRSALWGQTNPDRKRDYARAYMGKSCVELDDRYLKALLVRGTDLKHDDISNDMLTFKRGQLMLHRALHEADRFIKELI